MTNSNDINLLYNSIELNNLWAKRLKQPQNLGALSGIIILLIWHMLLAQQLHTAQQQQLTQQQTLQNATDTVQQERRNLLSKISHLEQLNHEKTYPALLLLNLSTKLPNNLFLTAVEKSDLQGLIQGKAQNLEAINTLLNDLTKLPGITTAALSKTQQTSNDQYHNFTINLTFKN